MKTIFQGYYIYSDIHNHIRVVLRHTGFVDLTYGVNNATFFKNQQFAERIIVSVNLPDLKLKVKPHYKLMIES